MDVKKKTVVKVLANAALAGLMVGQASVAKADNHNKGKAKPAGGQHAECNKGGTCKTGECKPGECKTTADKAAKPAASPAASPAAQPKKKH